MSRATQNRFRIERLDETGVDHADVEPFGTECGRGPGAIPQQRAAGDDHAIVSPLKDLGTTQIDRRRRAIDPLGRGLRVAERGGTIMLQGEIEHRHQVRFVARGHHGHVREQPHVTDVVRAVMRWTVRTREAGTVEHERDGQVLQRHFLKNLIVAALQESAVNVDDGTQARLGLAGGKGHGVRFANAGVEEAIGKRVAHALKIVSLAHGGRHHRDLGIRLQRIGDRRASHVGIGADRALLHGHAAIAFATERRGVWKKTGSSAAG